MKLAAELPAALHPSNAVEALSTAWQTGQIADKLLLSHNPPSLIVAPPGVRKRAVWSQPRPLDDIKLLQNQDALLAIMKDGRLHKAPAA